MANTHTVNRSAARGSLDRLVRRSVGLAKAPHKASPELLGKTDDDALRSAYIGKSICVLVLHFANELGTVRERVRNDSVDVIDDEHDATDA
jgi:hypothetical protein